MTKDAEGQMLNYNVTLIGMYAVGKTSIINKLRQNRFCKSYKPTEDKKILKYTLSNKLKRLENTTVKISFKDSAGLTCTHSNDNSFLQRKSHILCFVYDHDNMDSYRAIKYILKNNDALYSTNRIIMVIRNKVDNKSMISDYQAQCDKDFKDITSINEEIMFVKNFSAKRQSQDKIEKIFIKAIELYRQYYGSMPPPGGSKKKTLKSDAYIGTKNSITNGDIQSKQKKNKNKLKKRVNHEHDGKGKHERTRNMSDGEPETPTPQSSAAQCQCVVL